MSSIAVVLFSLILLWRNPLVFWNDDYQISILPVFEDIARSWREGDFPLLSPYSWICGNLAGEYQYGTFSIFINAAVVVIWNVFTRFAHQAAALSIVHLIVLATGGFALARARNLSRPLAVMVSLIAALNGWIICWGASDWFGALGAFAWFPWAWWGLERALASDVALAARQCSQKDHRPGTDATANRYRFLWPAPFVYLVATGGFPYTVLMLGLLIVWVTIKALIETKSVRAILPMLFGAALGFGLAAPALLALFAYVHRSAREVQAASSHWQWIVPPTALPGLILPSWTVTWANFGTRYLPHAGTELACGLVAPAALICGLILKTRAVIRWLRWELLLLGLVLIIAMLPTAGLFRWSFRWLPFFHLILALCAAECLALLGGENGHKSPQRLFPAVLALVAVGVTALAMMMFHTGGKYAFPLTWILVVLAAVWAGLELAIKGRAPASLVRAAQANPAASPSSGRQWIPATVTFISLLATYLCIPTNCGVPRFNFTESLLNPAPLDPDRLYLSIYPPPEVAYWMENHPEPLGQIVRPGSTSMWGKLHFINGYSPIQPSGVATKFYSSVHGEIDSGTASLLLLQQAGPEGDLALIGVDGITIAKEIELNPQPANEWTLVTSTGDGRVFHRNGSPFPRVRSMTSSQSRSGEQFTSAKISAVSEFRNRVEANVEVSEGAASALIAFSRPYFEGYQASLGEKKLSVRSERGLFPVIELPGGSRGRLVLSYRPRWLVYGSGLAVGCAVIWLVGLIFATRRRQ
ncbi:MAG TPA: hypothetical protein VGM62_11205 [Chthoniobacterales bacterium]